MFIKINTNIDITNNLNGFTPVGATCYLHLINRKTIFFFNAKLGVLDIQPYSLP